MNQRRLSKLFAVVVILTLIIPIPTQSAGIQPVAATLNLLVAPASLRAELPPRNSQPSVSAADAGPELATASWSPNEKVNLSEDAEIFEKPALAVDVGGNVYALWMSGSRNLYFAKRGNSGTWSSPHRVNEVPGVVRRMGDIGLDASGTLYAVWTDARNGNNDIYFSTRSGGLWSANVRVNDDTGTANQQAPRLAVDEFGVYAVWADSRIKEGTSDIYYASRSSTGHWSTNERISPYPGGTWQVDPDIDLDDGHNITVAWEAHLAGNPQIYATSKPYQGSWAEPAPVKWNHEWKRDVSLAVSPGGKACVAWENYNERQIWYSCRPAGGTWQADQPVPGSCCNPGNPSAAMDSMGNLSVMWEDEQRGGDVHVAHLLGNSWTTPVRVNDDAGSAHQGYPALAIDDSSHMYALWPDGRAGRPFSGDLYFSTTAGVADLSVEDIWWEPATPEAMTSATLFVRVKNVGSEIYRGNGNRFGLMLRLTDADSPGDYWEYVFEDDGLDSLGAGVTTIVWHTNFAFTRQQVDHVKVTLLPTGAESNTANNSREEAVTITPPKDSLLDCLSIFLNAVIFGANLFGIDVRTLTAISANFTLTLAKIGAAISVDAKWDAVVSFVVDSAIAVGADLAQKPAKVVITFVVSAFEAFYSSLQCGSALYDAIIRINDDMNARGYDYNTAIVESPVHVQITNQAGQRVGFAASGAVVNEIPDAVVDVNSVGHKLILYPGKDTAAINLVGSGSGTFSLRLALAKGDRVTDNVYYTNVPISTGALGSIVPSNPAYTLRIDDNADGIVDRTVAPSRVETVKGEAIYLPMVCK